VLIACVGERVDRLVDRLRERKRVRGEMEEDEMGGTYTTQR
jgi:hypothetical protein